jgi:hypothetical protein
MSRHHHHHHPRHHVHEHRHRNIHHASIICISNLLFTILQCFPKHWVPRCFRRSTALIRLAGWQKPICTQSRALSSVFSAKLPIFPDSPCARSHCFLMPSLTSSLDRTTTGGFAIVARDMASQLSAAPLPRQHPQSLPRRAEK